VVAFDNMKLLCDRYAEGARRHNLRCVVRRMDMMGGDDFAG
jgi:hypothetical protein